jgi:transposase
LEQLARKGLIKGKTIGVDSTTLEANAAMKSIARRDTQEGYTDYLKRLAEAAEGEPPDGVGLVRMDRKRAKTMSNQEWISPADPEAEITRLKEGRTALAHKAEQAVNMESGAILAVTTHAGSVADTATLQRTVCEAGVAVSELLDEPRNRHRVAVLQVLGALCAFYAPPLPLYNPEPSDSNLRVVTAQSCAGIRNP